jgi:putative transposase
MSKYNARAAPGEWFHCYNRGVEKRDVFMLPADFRRFQLQMLCSNTSKSFMLSNVRRSDIGTLFTETPSDITRDLVEIGAYALMPNHFHIIVREIAEGGRAKFMQKLMTGYSMYFNTRHKHSGPLFAGTYKATHIESDRYLRQVTAYVLLNPVEIKIPKWKNTARNREAALFDAAAQYQFSSGPDQLTQNARPESKLISTSLFNEDFSPQELVRDALSYYQSQIH